MGGLDSFCQIKSSTNGTADPQAEATLFRLKSAFRTIIVVISALGVAGNILNLVTLRSLSLRNVPFMFIRALALFDLISLVAILLLFTLEALQIEADPIIFYEVWVQDVLINSFLVAGLYCAVLLTIERFLLIRKPLSTGARLLSIENTVLVKIGMALLSAILLHTPMALQWHAKCAQYSTTTITGNGNEFEQEKAIGDVEGGGGHCLHWSRGKFNNRALLCHDPFFALYNYYKMGRELLRFFCVLLLIFLNAVIVRHLQMAKRKRRLLIKRVSMVTTATLETSNEKHQQHLLNGQNQHQNTVKRISATHIDRSRKDQLNTLMRSFTEKKLTALMVAICVIFAIGNIPQMVVMAVQNEALESSYSFQVFRQVANTAEVLNHCLNFFIFCMASSEYCRAFLSLSPVRWCLCHFPICASLARARLSGRSDSSHLVIKCMGPNESASDCLNTHRKKSSLGTVLASSEIGWSSTNGNNGGGHCPAAGAATYHRYRRDVTTSMMANGQNHQRSGQWSQRSLVGTVLIVERKSSATLLTNVANNAEWPTSSSSSTAGAATVQLIGPPPPDDEGMCSSSEESNGSGNGNGNGNGNEGVTAGGVDDDFL